MPRRHARRPSITDSTTAGCVAILSVKTSLTMTASIKNKGGKPLEWVSSTWGGLALSGALWDLNLTTPANRQLR